MAGLAQGAERGAARLDRIAPAWPARPAISRVLPGRDGKAAGAVLVLSAKPTLWDFGALATRLPAGTWRLASDTAPVSPTDAAVAIGLGTWRFERYRSKKGKAGAKIVWPQGADKARATAMIEAIFMARDLITTPSSDMGPAELAAAAQALGKAHKAKVSVIVGDDLLKQNYPMVHAVGRASSRAPRLIDLVWGRESDPKVTLVGKGVCFDTGGLDLKPATGMLNMKKDMGGAATVMAVAAMVMAAKLPVRLRLLVPAVENSVSGNAFRPLDVVPTRKGITVEIGNTDAEGRLILCDALHEGASEKPTMMVDCATLTGAARVALGTDLPALFCNDDALADELLASRATRSTEPMWRLPLFAGYRRLLDSKVADINNAPGVRLRRRHHRGALSEGVRARRRAVGAFRHDGLEQHEPPRPPRRRRGPGRAGDLRHDREADRE